MSIAWILAIRSMRLRKSVCRFASDSHRHDGVCPHATASSAGLGAQNWQIAVVRQFATPYCALVSGNAQTAPPRNPSIWKHRSVTRQRFCSRKRFSCRREDSRGAGRATRRFLNTHTSIYDTHRPGACRILPAGKPRRLRHRQTSSRFANSRTAPPPACRSCARRSASSRTRCNNWIELPANAAA